MLKTIGIERKKDNELLKEEIGELNSIIQSMKTSIETIIEENNFYRKELERLRKERKEPNAKVNYDEFSLENNLDEINIVNLNTDPRTSSSLEIQTNTVYSNVQTELGKISPGRM